MPAVAIIEADLGTPGQATGMNAKIFAPTADAVVATVASGFAEQTNRKGVYRVSQALGLTGRYYIQFYNTAGTRLGSGWVYMTDTIGVHIVVSYAAVGDAAGDVAGSKVGPGADACTFTFASNGVPAVNARVWITTDQGGTNVIAGTLYTNDNGQVTFMLTNGLLYYLWVVQPGDAPIQGQPFNAVKD